MLGPDIGQVSLPVQKQRPGIVPECGYLAVGVCTGVWPKRECAAACHPPCMNVVR